MPRTKKPDIRLENCPCCSDSSGQNQPVDMLYEHIKNSHGEEGIRVWRLKRARERRLYWDNNLPTVTTITGLMGSGKSLFATTQILFFLCYNKADLVISNMRFNTELLSNPDQWKSSCREYIESHYPVKWKETIKQEYGHDKIITVKRESVIERCYRDIDGLVATIKPEQIVHIDTERTSSDEILRIIEAKAKELGLVDPSGQLLIRVILLWDEAFSVLESRRAGSSLVIDLSQFSFQARHYGCKIWVISPMFEAVDLRYRNMTEAYIETRGLNNGKLNYLRAKMRKGVVVAGPDYWSINILGLVPAFFFYNSWERHITTTIEIENQQRQESQESRTAELQEYCCEICNRVVIGATNFKSHKASHTADTTRVLPAEDRDLVVDQIQSYLASHPEAGPTEIAIALNIPRTTVQSGLERMRRTTHQ